MTGLRITEVSLSLHMFNALPVAIRHFRTGIARSHLCFYPETGAGGLGVPRSSGSPCGNVPDDCLFSCQGSMSFDNPILPKKEALSRMSERLDKSSKSSFFYAFGQGCDILEKARNYRRKEPIPCRQNSPFRKN